MSSKTRTAVGFVMTVIALMLVTFIVGPMPIVKADPPPSSEYNNYRQREDLRKRLESATEPLLEQVKNDCKKLPDKELWALAQNKDNFVGGVAYDIARARIKTRSTNELMTLFQNTPPPATNLALIELAERTDYDLETVFKIYTERNDLQTQATILIATRINDMPTSEALVWIGRFPEKQRPVHLVMWRDDYPFLAMIKHQNAEDSWYMIDEDRLSVRATKASTKDLVTAFSSSRHEWIRVAILLELVKRPEAEVTTGQLIAMLDNEQIRKKVAGPKFMQTLLERSPTDTLSIDERAKLATWADKARWN